MIKATWAGIGPWRSTWIHIRRRLVSILFSGLLIAPLIIAQARNIHDDKKAGTIRIPPLFFIYPNPCPNHSFLQLSPVLRLY
jgi:hypothetical protein